MYPSIENWGTIISESKAETMVREIIEIFEDKELSYGTAITLLDLVKEKNTLGVSNQRLLLIIS